MSNQSHNPRAPMASAPLKYLPDGSVDWANMWDSFCALAHDGGPPHRATMLRAQADANPRSADYRAVVAELRRGIAAVSGLNATMAAPGWIAVRCPAASMARWLREAIEQENVEARVESSRIFLPVGEAYTLAGEIKNVITAVAKTTHFWREHFSFDAKRKLATEARRTTLSAASEKKRSDSTT